MLFPFGRRGPSSGNGGPPTSPWRWLPSVPRVSGLFRSTAAARRFHFTCAVVLQILLLSSTRPILAYVRPPPLSAWPPRQSRAFSSWTSAAAYSPYKRDGRGGGGGGGGGGGDDLQPSAAVNPPGLVEFELTKGVAGSRKTQHAVTRAYQAGSSGEANQVLFLVKVGSNAQEIRSRLESQMGLTFKRHRKTNHFVARERKKASYWVANFDAFVDCQLRAHESLRQQLQNRGANFEWKRRELLRLVRDGQHRGFCLKDGSIADFVLLDEAQDLREEDMEIVSRLVESESRRGGALRKVLVVGDVEQTVFSDVLTGRSRAHPMDMLPAWMPSVNLLSRRLDVNYRCPHTHVAFNNLAMPRNGTTDAPVKPSPEMTDPVQRRQNKPYLFTYVQSSSTVQNYDAYRTACRISEMVLTFLRSPELPGLRLQDIAITSRFVNVNLILLQLEDVLERVLVENGYALPEGGCVHLFRTKVTDRKSINWEEAGEKLVMGSLTAFKGKDWRVVILLDCTEGVLPSKSSVHTAKELVDRSLFNVVRPSFLSTHPPIHLPSSYHTPPRFHLLTNPPTHSPTISRAPPAPAKSCSSASTPRPRPGTLPTSKNACTKGRSSNGNPTLLSLPALTSTSTPPAPTTPAPPLTN